MRWLRAFAVLAVLSVVPPLLVAAPAAAAPTWTSPEVLGFGGYDVQMDVGSSGDAVAAWSFEKGIKASYRPVGKDWQRPVVLERNVSGVLDVFVDRRGVARVVWWDETQMGVATRSLRGNWRLDDDAPGEGSCCWVSTPQVAADADGNLVAAWEVTNDLTGTYQSFFWRTAAGRWTSVDGGTNPYRSGIVVHDGRVTVIDGLRELREATAPLNGDLRTSRIIRSGGEFGRPVLAANDRGDMLLAVLENADGMLQGYDPGELVLMHRTAGEDWTTVVDGGGELVDSPAVALNDSGDLAVAYRRADDAVVVRLGRLGGALGDEHVVGHNGARSETSIAVAADGAVSVTWSQGTGKRQPVFVATKPAGKGWADPARLGTQVDSPYSELRAPSVHTYPNGMFTAVFADGTAARWADHVDDDTGPATSMRAPRRVYTVGTRFRVAWDATDELARPDTYDVRYRVAGRAGKLGRWHRWLTDTERDDRRFHGKAGRTYCFAARTSDRVGNRGRWSAQRCTTTPLDDRAFAVRSRDWDRVHNRRAYRDTLTVADRPSQTLRLGGVAATELRLLVRTCPRCGTVVVHHRGKRIGTVDTGARRSRSRVVVVERYDQRRTGAVVIRTRGRGPVRIDGVIASR